MLAATVVRPESVQDWIVVLIPVIGPTVQAIMVICAATMVYLSARHKEWRDRRLKALAEASIGLEDLLVNAVSGLKTLIDLHEVPEESRDSDWKVKNVEASFYRKMAKSLAELRLFHFEGCALAVQEVDSVLNDVVEEVVKVRFDPKLPKSAAGRFKPALEAARQALIKKHDEVEQFGFRQYLSERWRLLTENSSPDRVRMK